MRFSTIIFAFTGFMLTSLPLAVNGEVIVNRGGNLITRQTCPSPQVVCGSDPENYECCWSLACCGQPCCNE